MCRTRLAWVLCISSTVSLAQAAPGPAGLLGHWKFDEGSGASTADSSGLEATGVLGEGVSWVSDTPSDLGKKGSALEFTGPKAQVSVADASMLSFGGNDFSPAALGGLAFMLSSHLLLFLNLPHVKVGW